MERAVDALTDAPQASPVVEDDAAPPPESNRAQAPERKSDSPSEEVQRLVVEEAAQPLRHRTEHVVGRTIGTVAPLGDQAVTKVTSAVSEASDGTRERVEQASAFLIEPLGELPAVRLLPAEDGKVAGPAVQPRPTYAGTDGVPGADAGRRAQASGGWAAAQALAQPVVGPLAAGASSLFGTAPDASVPAAGGERIDVSHEPPLRPRMAPECPAPTTGAGGGSQVLVEALGAVAQHPYVATISALAGYDFLPPRERASSPSASPD